MPRLASKPSISTSKLVERLIALVVAARPSRAACLADGVQLVDEDQARRLGLGLGEEVPDPRGADAHEELDEVGAGEREERHARLAGHRAGQQRLAGARSADQEDALGNPPAQRAVLSGRPEELDDLLQLGDDLVMTGDVLEGDALLVAAVEARPALGEGHGRAHAAGARDHPGKRQQHEQEERARKDDRLQRGRPGFGLVVAAGNVGVEQADQVLVVLHADPGDPVADRPAVRGSTASSRPSIKVGPTRAEAISPRSSCLRNCP